MKKSYNFTGSTYGASILTIDNDKIIIERKGILSFFNKGFAGIKTIRIDQITGTQYKKCGINNGYLQFIIVGSQEVKKGLKAAQHDENSIVWAHKKQNEYAEEIIEYINSFNLQKNNNNFNNTSEDNYDKLKKIKALLDENIISQEEFEKEKQKLLQ